MADFPGIINYPTTLDTAVSLIDAANNASSTLTAGIAAGDLLIPVADPAEFPTSGLITLVDSLSVPTKMELVAFTSKAGSDLVVPALGRGLAGTTAQSWVLGNFVQQRPTAQHHKTLSAAVIALQARIGTVTGGMSAPFNIVDNANGIVANYAPVKLVVNYDAIAATPATLVNLGLHSRINYGYNSSSQGTLHAATTLMDVGPNSTAPDSEVANLMGWMRIFSPVRAWFTDWTLNGAIAQQQQLLNGVTMTLNNHFNGSPVNSPSACFTAVTSQGKGAGGETGHNAAATWPVNIGFAVAGHSGEVGDGGTRRGFDYAFKAGKNASGWMVDTERSKIGVGVLIDDYDTDAYQVGRPIGVNASGFNVLTNTTGGVDRWLHVVNFDNVVAADISVGGSLIKLPHIADPKLAIAFGNSSRLCVGSGGIIQAVGRMGVGGPMTYADSLLEVVGSAAASDPLFAVGSAGAAHANSFKVYNGSSDVTTFISGSASQFMPGTAAGDGGFRVGTTKSLFFGDASTVRIQATPTQVLIPVTLVTTSPRITTGLLDVNGNPTLAFTPTASAVNGFTIINAITNQHPVLLASGASTHIGITLMVKGTQSVGIGGNTASFPGLANSGAILQIALADRSAFTSVQASFYHSVSSSGSFVTGTGGGDTAITRFATATWRLSNNSTGGGALLIAPAAAALTGSFTVLPDNAATNATVNVARFGVNSTGAAAAGFGGILSYTAESSTTVDTLIGDKSWSWVVATHGSRTGRIVHNVYDTAAREGFRIEASGSAPMIGFLGAAAVVRQTVSAAASDPATTQTLANSLRTALINLGLCV